MKEMVKTKTRSEVVDSNLPVLAEPRIETEEELFNLADGIAKKMHESRLVGCYQLGACLNACSYATYGDGTIERLSKHIGIGRHTLYKSRQFARNFSIEEFEELLTGDFPMTWNVVQVNLTLKSEDFVEVYKSSTSKKEFIKRVKKLKGPKDTPKETQENEVCSTQTNSDNGTDENKPTAFEDTETNPGDYFNQGDDAGKIDAEKKGDQENETPLDGDSENTSPEGAANTPNQMTYFHMLSQKGESDLYGSMNEEQTEKDTDSKGQDNIVAHSENDFGEKYHDTNNRIWPDLDQKNEKHEAREKFFRRIIETMVKEFQTKIKCLRKKNATQAKRIYELEEKIKQLQWENDDLLGQLHSHETFGEEKENVGLVELNF